MQSGRDHSRAVRLARPLDRVHRLIRLLDQSIQFGAVIRKNREADARIKHDLIVLERERLADFAGKPIGMAQRAVAMRSSQAPFTAARPSAVRMSAAALAGTIDDRDAQRSTQNRGDEQPQRFADAAGHEHAPLLFRSLNAGRRALVS